MKRGVGIGAASLIRGRKGLIADGFAPAQPSGGVMRVVASGNGIRVTEKAMEFMLKGTDLLDTVIAGVNIVEEDPNDMSVGYGGLPNEEGNVELDASVMYGSTNMPGAVAALQFI